MSSLLWTLARERERESVKCLCLPDANATQKAGLEAPACPKKARGGMQGVPMKVKTGKTWKKDGEAAFTSLIMSSPLG